MTGPVMPGRCAGVGGSKGRKVLSPFAIRYRPRELANASSSSSATRASRLLAVRPPNTTAIWRRLPRDAAAARLKAADRLSPVDRQSVELGNRVSVRVDIGGRRDITNKTHPNDLTNLYHYPPN